MIRLDRISKVYPHGEVLKEITWEVKAGERAGLVGANGSGKTTQFRIILGDLEPTSGDVFRAKDARIAYLSQEFEINPDNTIRDELLTAFSEAHQIKMSLVRVQDGLNTATGEELEKLLRKLDRLQQEFEAADGYGLERRVEKILPDIGLSTADGDRLVSSLSGGWQMRLGFGKVMLRQPDLLLLDEPTNHIDLETIEWLEGYLLKQTVPMVIVSHDRRFLDRLCTKIIEVERGEATTYPGNYSSYVAAKEEIRAAQQAAYERQQEELARQQAFIDRFRASATRSTQAKSREKQIEKIEKIEAPLSELRGLKFHFPACARSGKEVAIVDSLMHAYDDNILFLDASLGIERGDKIALIGPNGCGKSTLLRLLTGREKPMEGEVRLGEHNIITGYFEQNQAEALDRDKTVLDTISDDVYHWKDVEIRGLLGRFLFSGDTVYKKVCDLSGGEKARLALAKLLTRQVNFLILDEPTNHLDIPAKETLEDAIRSFDGAVVVVSHDRYFISQIANKIIEIKDASFKVYEGGYEYYLERVEKERQEAIEAELENERLERQAAKRARQKEKDAARKAARKEKEKS